MNKLKAEKHETVIRALVEGASIRSVERMTGVHRDTITRLTVSASTTCGSILDDLMRDLTCKRIELDEVWCYVGKKQRHVRHDDKRRMAIKERRSGRGCEREVTKGDA